MADEARPSRKYAIFISSTFEDLHEYRQSAILGILRAGHMPVALENFPPDSESTLAVIKQSLRECQYYVIILGARYGYVPSGEEKSFTEIELDLALDAGLKILAFVLDRRRVEEFRASEGFRADLKEMHNVDKYEALRGRLVDGPDHPFYRPMSGREDVEKHLFAYFYAPHSVPGYILEPKDRSTAHVLEITAKNEIVRDVVQSLGKFMYVDPRLTSDADKKNALARAFECLFGDHVERKYEKVFFESGSTVTYVAKLIAERLPKRGQLSRRTPEVLTNNAFAYLYLWLCSEVMCHPVPEGPPDVRYGGIYGPLTGRSMQPDYDLPPLAEYDPVADQEIKELATTVFGSMPRSSSILLAAASGLQLTEEVTALDEDGRDVFDDKSILERVKRCRGFHVGSYENKLFKRCYYLSNIPTVVFLHDSKIDCPIRVGKCHFLFDDGTPWEEFVTTYPLSIWTACEKTSVDRVLAKFRSHLSEGHWLFSVYGAASNCPVIIGHNGRFREFTAARGIQLPLLTPAARV